MWAINDISIPLAEINLGALILASFHANACEQLNGASKAIVSTAVWSIAGWYWWGIHVHARSWSLLSVELNALCINWASNFWSWDHHTFLIWSHHSVISSIQAIREETFLGSHTSLLVFDS